MPPDKSKRSKLEPASSAPETEAMANLGKVVIPPPARDRILASAYMQAESLLQDEEERKMNSFYLLFTGKRWSTRLAVGLAIALVMAACLTVTLVPRPQGGGYTLEPAQPALASQPGYLLAAFTSAEDEAAAKAEAEQLQKLAQELITLKQGELEQLQAMLDELQAELEAKQALVAQELEGRELTGEEQAKLDQLEKELQAKAEQLMDGSDRLLELAGLLSAKEQLVREQADVIKLNLEDMELPSNIQIKSAVEQGEDGKYMIYLTLPNLPAEVAEQLKQELGQRPGLEKVEVDGVSIVTGVEDGLAPDVLRQLDKATKCGKECMILTLRGDETPDGPATVAMKEIDDQIVVRVESATGKALFINGEDFLKDGEFNVENLPEYKSLDLDELGKLYKVVVTGEDEALAITMPGEGAGKIFKRLDAKVQSVDELLDRVKIKVLDGEAGDGSVYQLIDGATGTFDKLLDNPGAKLFMGDLDDERLKQLQLDGYIGAMPDVDKIEKLESLGYIMPGDADAVMDKIAKGVPEGWEVVAPECAELEEGSIWMKGSGDAQFLVMPSDKMRGTALDGASLENMGKDGGVAFEWLNDENLGHIVFTRGTGGEFRAVELGEVKVYIGDEDAYAAELARIRTYLQEHYPGQDAGYKAAGKDGKLTVKVLLDGMTVEVLHTERAAEGEIQLTSQE